MKILVVNAGSSSLKYQLIDMDGEKVIAKGICERIGIDGVLSGSTADGDKFKVESPMPDHTAAFLVVKSVLTEGEHAVISDMSEISAVGHRIVQGADLYSESVLVTEEVVTNLEKLIPLAPLHNPGHVQGIRSCQQVLGDSVPQVVVFDTAFHSTMPAKAYMFGLPYEYYEKYAVRRYGFHGTSHKFVSRRCGELMGKDLEGVKMVTCHLGNGCSISAVKDGKCIDTSMGLTPLDGFMMGTRCGGVDPSIFCYLATKEEDLTFEKMNTIMNKQSGVLGISGVSSDDRDVLAAAEAGNERAKLARDMQHYQILKYVGSYIAAMNGVDVIVFTGGLGENTVDLRSDVCNGLQYLGVEIDEALNEVTRKGKEGKISTDNSKVEVYVIPTDEEMMIARETKDIVSAL